MNGVIDWLLCRLTIIVAFALVFQLHLINATEYESEEDYEGESDYESDNESEASSTTFPPSSTTFPPSSTTFPPSTTILPSNTTDHYQNCTFYGTVYFDDECSEWMRNFYIILVFTIIGMFGFIFAVFYCSKKFGIQRSGDFERLIESQN